MVLNCLLCIWVSCVFRLWFSCSVYMIGGFVCLVIGWFYFLRVCCLALCVGCFGMFWWGFLCCCYFAFVLLYFDFDLVVLLKVVHYILYVWFVI